MIKFYINNYKGIYHTITLLMFSIELYIFNIIDFVIQSYIFPFIILYMSYRITEFYLKKTDTNRSMIEKRREMEKK